MADFKLEDDLFDHYSHGWFPSCYNAREFTIYGSSFSDVFDKANNIRSNSFVSTTNGFCGSSPYSKRSYRDIKVMDKDENTDEGYPVTNNDEYKFYLIQNLLIPLQLRFDGGLRISEGMLFADDTTRSFLSLSGVKQNFQEVSVLHLKEHSAVVNIGLQMPVYGIFFKSNIISVSSFYYLRGSIGASYAITTDATQYIQIADIKNQLRYSNAQDTATLSNAIRLPNLNRFRYELEFSAGWHLSFERVIFNFELYSTYPISSVINDAVWKQYIVGIRTGLGIQFFNK